MYELFKTKKKAQNIFWYQIFVFIFLLTVLKNFMHTHRSTGPYIVR